MKYERATFAFINDKNILESHYLISNGDAEEVAKKKKTDGYKVEIWDKEKAQLNLGKNIIQYVLKA